MPDVTMRSKPDKWANLAYLYRTNGLNGKVNFFANPYAIGANILTNYSNSTYNSLQLEARHQTFIATPIFPALPYYTGVYTGVLTFQK